jgi:hypothetical protein
VDLLPYSSEIINLKESAKAPARRLVTIEQPSKRLKRERRKDLRAPFRDRSQLNKYLLLGVRVSAKHHRAF